MEAILTVISVIGVALAILVILLVIGIILGKAFDRLGK
jgi:hypothetical protein